MKIKFFIFFTAILMSISLLAKADTDSLYFRMPLSIKSTPTNLYYFHCTITRNKSFPPNLTVPFVKIHVVMANEAQNISRFNYDGLLYSNAKMVNTYAFASYHDTRAHYANMPGFVDVFVARAGFRVTCQEGKGDREIIPSFG